MDWNEIAQLVGYADEEQMLRDMYHQLHLSVNEIADKLGSGKATILRRMKMYGIEVRGRGGANNQSHKRALLHLLDQRFVRSNPSQDVAKVINAHQSTVWKYLKGR
jgi:hypothetical protein